MAKTKKGYLGIDCGSVGIKAALIDEEGEVVNSVYFRNSGVIETLKKGLERIASEDYEIKGVGVTGSGRSFAGALTGADFIKTEILAHCLGTLHFYPNVRTILDIGGEDCKIISVKDGVMENFIMNSVCGAGTGSVIDSIANRLQLNIEEVGDVALQSKKRLDFPGKCGVFTQSAVVSKLNLGYNKSDIMSGVIRALVSNYLMLGRGIELSPPFVYQGATAQNKAIVKCLEEELKSEVIVPQHAPIMGAIGIGIYAQNNIANNPTNFRGFRILDQNISQKTVKAKGCENYCEINYILIDGKTKGAYGNRCDKCQPKFN